MTTTNTVTMLGIAAGLLWWAGAPATALEPPDPVPDSHWARAGLLFSSGAAAGDGGRCRDCHRYLRVARQTGSLEWWQHYGTCTERRAQGGN